MTGMITQVMLIAALAEIIALSGVGLSAAGWVVGITCGAVMNAGLARGLSHYRSDRLSPADWVTLARQRSPWASRYWSRTLLNRPCR